jgi:predicted nuclease of predicted toxin-antitoxin system
MKFLVDAQLPRRLAKMLRDAGHDAIHTLDLPGRNRTSDLEINRVSLQEQRVVITKDADFVDSYHLHRKPWKLVLVSTGNIANDELMTLFATNVTGILNDLGEANFVEINRESVIIHS